jgi:predicted DNA-binding transcriptional regulator YafY
VQSRCQVETSTFTSYVHAASVVITERVPRGVVVEPVNDETCVVYAKANTIEMLTLYLGMMDVDFTVTEPPELVARLRKMAERFLSAVASRST